MENESKTENESQAARLLEKHGDRVFRTAFMYLKNYQDAEDVLQMTFPGNQIHILKSCKAAV